MLQALICEDYGASDMGYRRANVNDIPILCNARKQQLIDEGLVPEQSIDNELTTYYTQTLRDGTLVEWLLEEDGEIVATAAIVFMPFPPTFTNPQGTRGYISSMYTAPTHRGRGIATTMLGLLVDEATRRGVHKVLLSSSRMGRPVYQKYGFVESDTYMELDI